MTTARKPAHKAESTSTDEPGEAAAEVEARIEGDLEKGYHGSTPDDDPYGSGLDNTLLTGPDGPPLVPDNTTRAVQPPSHLED